MYEHECRLQNRTVIQSSSKMNSTLATEAIGITGTLMESTSTESAFIAHSHISRFTWFDNFFFVVLLGLSTLIGIFYGFVSKHKQNNTSEYILGGRTMKIIPIATSLVSSHISGQTMLGIPVEVYSNGTQYIIFIVSAVSLGLALSYIYLPLFFNLQMTSSFHYLERRFGSTVRLMASAMYVFKSLCFIPIVVYVPALALSQVTGIELHLISPIICTVCVFYTTVGGLRAVVWSDFIQFLLIICAVIAVVTLGTFEVGGVSEVFAAANRGGRLKAFEFDPNPLVRTSFWTVSVGLTVNWLALMGVGQTNLQRFLSVPDLKSARRSVVIFIFGMVFIKTMTIFIGLCIYAKYEHCDPVASGMVAKPDQILPHFVTEVGGKIPGLPGLFIAGIFAAALSTMSSSLNTMSGIIYDDFVKPYHPKTTEKQASNIMKWTVIILGIIVTSLVLVVEKLGSIFQMGIAIGGLANGAYLGIFTIGMTSRAANTKGIMIGSAVSMLFVATILVGAQINHVSQAPTLPLQTDQCDVAHFINSTSSATNVLPAVAAPEVFWLFRLSFMYYSLTGLIVMVAVSSIVSRLTEGTSQEVDESLLLERFRSDEYKERMSKIKDANTKYTEVDQNGTELNQMTQKIQEETGQV